RLIRPVYWCLESMKSANCQKVSSLFRQDSPPDNWPHSTRRLIISSLCRPHLENLAQPSLTATAMPMLSRRRLPCVSRYRKVTCERNTGSNRIFRRGGIAGTFTMGCAFLQNRLPRTKRVGSLVSNHAIVGDHGALRYDDNAVADYEILAIAVRRVGLVRD